MLTQSCIAKRSGLRKADRPFCILYANSFRFARQTAHSMFAHGCGFSTQAPMAMPASIPNERPSPIPRHIPSPL